MTPFKRPKLRESLTDATHDFWGDDSNDELILLASQVVDPPEQPTNTQAEFRNFMNDFEREGASSTAESSVGINVQVNSKVTSKLVLNQNRVSEAYLKRRIETLEKEKQKALDECLQVAENLALRDYEMSSLKYELKEAHRSNNDLRIKLVKNEQLKKDQHSNRVQELEKQVRKFQTELDLKSIEVTKLKSGRRLSRASDAPPKLGKNKTETRSWFINKPVLPYEGTPVEGQYFTRVSSIFQNVDNVSRFESILEGCLSKMIKIIALSMDPATVSLSRDNVNLFIKLVDRGLDLVSNSMVTQSPIPLEKDDPSRLLVVPVTEIPGESIFSIGKIYQEEGGIVMRRLLAICSAACFSSQDIRRKFVETGLFKRVFDAVLDDLKYDIRGERMGIIRAASVLLLLLGLDEQISHNWKVKVFKSLVFSRLDVSTLNILSDILVKFGRRSIDFSRKMCNGLLIPTGTARSFAINSVYNFAQFVPSECCALEVIGTALETLFPLDASLYDIDEYRRLLDTARNIMCFYRDCMTRGDVAWLQPQTEDEGHKTCHCYVKFTTGVLMMLYMCIKVFRKNRELRSDTRSMMTVAQLGLLLINDIFCINLHMKLLQNMGRPMKNRLITVYKWLIKYNDLFHFRLAQVRAINSFEVKLISNSLEKVPGGDESADRQAHGANVWIDIVI